MRARLIEGKREEKECAKKLYQKEENSNMFEEKRLPKSRKDTPNDGELGPSLRLREETKESAKIGSPRLSPPSFSASGELGFTTPWEESSGIAQFGGATEM
ncbi:hypothetical protein L484_017106 [Morus notabilis]|uniref:Uncharacterized protein n=1 Tax=Morus notabilis TaxID=981085 RepID=W9S1N8_9ROSA|nr:hypothetical protein L484_017106 [Morus notabilis]